MLLAGRIYEREPGFTVILNAKILLFTLFYIDPIYDIATKDTANHAEDKHLVEFVQDHLVKSYNHNGDPKIRNPLPHPAAAEHRNQVEAFCYIHGFEDKIDLFQKAALVAQNLGDTESIDALPEGNEYYLRRETTRSWYLPRTMYMCIGIVSIGSAVQQVDNNSRG